MRKKRKLSYSLECDSLWYCSSKRKWLPIELASNTCRSYSSNKIFYNKNKALRAFKSLLDKGNMPFLTQFNIIGNGTLLILKQWEPTTKQ